MVGIGIVGGDRQYDNRVLLASAGSLGNSDDGVTEDTDEVDQGEGCWLKAYYRREGDTWTRQVCTLGGGLYGMQEGG